MPVINGVYLKDFTALPGAVADADIIPIAISGDNVAYRTTVAGIVTDARITAKLLTGLSVTGSAVIAGDTILEAFGKVQNQINGKQGTVTLTTTGTSGAATFSANTLNIPNYADAFVGTVTSVAAITLGTTGTDLSSTVANGTTTPVITLQVPTASASNRGALSSADWSTFNGKAAALSGTINTIAYWNSSTTIASLALATYPSLTELSYVKGVTSAIQTQLNAKQATITLTTTGTSGASTLVGATLNIPQYQAAGTYVTSVTGTSPIVSSGGTTPAISIPVATTSVNGYLSSTDWTTFNNKTTNTGTVTSVGLSSATSGVTIASTPVTTSGTITIAIATATSGQNGLLSSTDWTTFNGKQATITLTTTGTSGAATFSSNTLNIPNYADGGVLSLSAIGGTANANAATITGTVLNLQPASASFGGVVTTGTQTFAGAKTLTSALAGTSATFSGDLTVDTNTLYVDSANNRVGIGTTAPLSKLGVLGNASIGATYGAIAAPTSGLIIEGNVLIGTTTDAGYKLDVQQGATNTAKFNFAVTGSWGGGANQDHGMIISGARYTSNTNTSLLHIINTDTTSLFKVTDWGDVGIGTASPAYKLDISGTLNATGAATFSSTATATAFIPSGATVPTNGMYLSAANTLNFATNTTNSLSISSTGAATFSSSVTATGFFESSSVAGKDIMQTNPLTNLNLDVIQYTRKTDESKDVRYGYSAEQIHSLMPELTDKDVTAVKYLDVHTLLIAQLQQEIKELKAKLN